MLATLFGLKTTRFTGADAGDIHAFTHVAGDLTVTGLPLETSYACIDLCERLDNLSERLVCARPSMLIRPMLESQVRDLRAMSDALHTALRHAFGDEPRRAALLATYERCSSLTGDYLDALVQIKKWEAPRRRF